MKERQLRRIALRSAAIAIFVGLAGCNSQPQAEIPETFPVTGNVTLNGEPVTSGAVEFRSLEDTTTTASGALNPDGAFKLSIFVGNQQVEGALPGPHEVTVHIMREGEHAPTSLTQPKPYVVQREANTASFDLNF